MTIDDRINGFLRFHSRKWVEYLREKVHKYIEDMEIDETKYDEVIAFVLLGPDSPYFKTEFNNDII